MSWLINIDIDKRTRVVVLVGSLIAAAKALLPYLPRWSYARTSHGPSASPRAIRSGLLNIGSRHLSRPSPAPAPDLGPWIVRRLK